MADEKLADLKTRLQEITDLRAAISVLGWDQATYMPSGGATARARQLATLSRLAHEKFTSAEIGRLLDALAPLEADLPYDSDDASIIRVTRHDFEQATRVPGEFLAEFGEHSADTYQRWSEARPTDDFRKVASHLEKTLELSRRYATYFPDLAHPADPLIDQSDEGMTVAILKPLFADLRERLVPIVERVAVADPIDDSPLNGRFPEADQLAYGLELAQAFGYDLTRGRQDTTPHPFATSFSVGDVRITTRVREEHLGEGLFSTLHETGHAMYEQGIAETLEGTPLGHGTSSGVHESQSRLWENLVGRSRAFWEHRYGSLQQRFPGQLGAVKIGDFYRAINKVNPSLIRTDADELTYNLHVIIRFDLECELLEGNLSVAELPEAWRERYRSDLGVAPVGDSDGVLQDVHWFGGLIGGAFQGYTLGNILSAQFFAAAVEAAPSIPEDIGRGEFGALHGWLREAIYRHGRKFTAPELIERATGRSMTVDPYLRYLEAKYLSPDLYG